jgi:baculoviral IAP repeat-containing protein 6
MLDQNYPISPPKMTFVLENVDGDGVPINPNLHTGGKGK